MAPNYDAFGYFFTIIISPMFLFAGIFFPVENLPTAVRFLPWLTPLYHAVVVIRALVLGTFHLSDLWHLGFLAALVILLIRVPLVMVKNRLIQ
ncbi:MAG: ABC transporter permease [Firmicutes bacterium]|nr:ABC transporter permease [Bacillota bacterium]